MKILDIDMDYFLLNLCNNNAEDGERYDNSIKPWEKENVIMFLEKNLHLSKNKKIPGRIITHHQEALYFWKELIDNAILTTPFEVLHIDSHADLGMGSLAPIFIFDKLLALNLQDRLEILANKNHKYHPKCNDYLLFAIAFEWISELTYACNPKEFDFHTEFKVGTLPIPDFIFKDFDQYIFKNKVYNKKIIQLKHNLYQSINSFRYFNSNDKEIMNQYLKNVKYEKEIPFKIISDPNFVNFNAEYDFLVFSISPNFTPESADFIIPIIQTYIEEI